MSNEILVFSNPGEIDIRGATVAGLSAKETKSAIGYFGTGLKYAIASILRWGGSITIYSGTTVYAFTAQEMRFREREFKQVCMSENLQRTTELGFTTEYGKDWQPWQVFRELYANARDEGGGVGLAFESGWRQMDNEAGKTVILVSGVPALTACYYERDEIILPPDKTWQQETSKLQFNLSPNSHIYYRGVRVADKRCRYTWNFLEIGPHVLTEDRTMKDSWSAEAAARVFLANDCNDEKVIESMLLRKVASAHEPSFETEIMNYFHAPEKVDECSETFARVAARLYRREPVRFKFLRRLAIDFDVQLAEVSSYKLSAREATMLERAKELVALFGFESEIASIPIEVCHLGESVLGKYEDGKIELSPNCFEQGTKQVVSTLYEECFHAKTGHADCTYNMQTALFNIIISLNEEVHNVIC